MPSPLTVPASTSTPAGTAMLMTTELLLLLLTVPIRFLNQPCGPCSWWRTSSRPSDQRDRQRIAVDLRDLDPGHVLVVGDDVEPAADDAEL